MKARALRLLVLGTALAALAPTAAACPTCSVGQGFNTLVYILGFLAIPYLVVLGVVFWIRRLTAAE